MTTLKKGSRGTEVKTLQKSLHLLVDGIFGVLTEEAVKEFQKANGLSPDGIVGAKTWTALGIDETIATASIKASKRTVKEIIVHCSATPEGEDFSVAQMRQWHLQRGFSDIGYHYVVYRDGSVHTGRDVNISGGHCTGHNSISIGICYIGGCPPRAVKDWQHKAKDTRTEAQKISLRKLLKELKTLYPKATIYGHRDFANKLCPSFDAKTEYANIK